MSTKKTLCILTFMCICGMAYTVPIQAAPTNPHIIYGDINDLLGNPVSGASIEITNMETGNSTTNTSTEDGYLVDIANIPGGYEDGDELNIAATCNILNIQWSVEKTILVTTGGSEARKVNLVLTDTEYENITNEQLFALLIYLQNDVDEINNTLETVASQIGDIESRLTAIESDTASIEDRLGYAGKPENHTIYNDIEQILLGLVYEVGEGETTWTLDEILEKQHTHHQEILDLFLGANNSGNATANITINLNQVMDELEQLQNISDEIVALNYRMFDRINTTLTTTDRQTLVTKIEETNAKPRANDIYDIVSDLDTDSETIGSIEENVVEQNETMTSIQDKINTANQNIKDTRGAIGTITFLIVIIVLIVGGLLTLVIKDYWEEIRNEQV